MGRGLHLSYPLRGRQTGVQRSRAAAARAAMPRSMSAGAVVEIPDGRQARPGEDPLQQPVPVRRPRRRRSARRVSRDSSGCVATGGRRIGEVGIAEDVGVVEGALAEAAPWDRSPASRARRNRALSWWTSPCRTPTSRWLGQRRLAQSAAQRSECRHGGGRRAPGARTSGPAGPVPASAAWLGARAGARPRYRGCRVASSSRPCGRARPATVRRGALQQNAPSPVCSIDGAAPSPSHQAISRPPRNFLRHRRHLQHRRAVVPSCGKQMAALAWRPHTPSGAPATMCGRRDRVWGWTCGAWPCSAGVSAGASVSNAASHRRSGATGDSCGRRMAVASSSAWVAVTTTTPAPALSGSHAGLHVLEHPGSVRDRRRAVKRRADSPRAKACRS